MSDKVRFQSHIEPWKPGATGGLMVATLPPDAAAAIGGLRQMRVAGTMNGAAFTSNTMPRGGGLLALSVSKAMMQAAGAGVGDAIDVEMERVERASPA
jgi:hypothetical protein